MHIAQYNLSNLGRVAGAMGAKISDVAADHFKHRQITFVHVLFTANNFLPNDLDSQERCKNIRLTISWERPLSIGRF